ncbi:MAG: NAD(P)-dependent oxidoreductase [Thermoanaerobaculia bacterium]|nr:NAD(P)-dependent oxidoreductase [Thermoanaerobaculia bacterium]MBP9822997.1 NAD(P)-dependent oxidoreductase [Thermoanaerobaculia bacterium]
MRPVPVLVTGATGFLGGHLVHALLAAGCRVDAVSRQARTSSSPNLRWWQADLAASGEAERVFAGSTPEVVFHLASLVTGRRERDLILPAFHANLESTVQLLAAATAAPAGSCRRIVLTGSMEEPDLSSGEAPGSPYAVAKAAATLYARFFRSLYGTPVVSARVFMVYGPGQVDHGKVVPYTILQALQKKAPQLTSGTRPVDWIYIDDVIAGLLALAEAPGIEGETFDLGSGELVTVRQVVEKICHALDAPPPEIGALADRPLEAVRRANIARSGSRLGWRPRVGLEEGLHRTIVGLRGELAATAAQAATAAGAAVRSPPPTTRL